MERVEAVCSKLETLASVESGERVEYDSDGSVHVVRSWSRWTRRKLSLSSTNQSRKTFISGTDALFELADQVASGVLRVPLVKETHGAGNSDGHAVQTLSDIDVASGAVADSGQDAHDSQRRFFSACDERTKQALQRLADALVAACGALNTLSASTYEEDTEIGAAMLKLINYATMQRERIVECLQSACH